MINKIIAEIKVALDNDLYILALMGSLTLIDSCGKAEYPNKGVGYRYEHWYNKYINPLIGDDEEVDILAGYDNKFNEIYIKDKLPELTGEVVYSLRCALLHTDNPNIQIEDIKTNYNKINKFVLCLEGKKDFEMFVDMSGVTVTNGLGNTVRIEREYHLNVRGFCLKVCQECEKYYNLNKNKFKFDYHILDVDKFDAVIKQNESRGEKVE